MEKFMIIQLLKMQIFIIVFILEMIQFLVYPDALWIIK